MTFEILFGRLYAVWQYLMKGLIIISRRIKYFAGQKETHPIKDQREIDALYGYFIKKMNSAKSDIKKYQAERNYMLVHIGLNTAFRAEDLLQLRVIDVKKGYVHIKENKTGKMQNFKMNKKLHNDILDYVSKYNLGDYDYLFMGQKQYVNGRKYIYPITRQQGHKIVTQAGKAIGIPYTFGLHSLRKTFGYQYMKNKGNVLTLMKMYNHDSPDVTMRYVQWGREDAEHDREAMYIGPKGR